MNKTEAIQAILDATSVQPIVFTTGFSSRIACGLDDRANHFYMTGSMGLASSVGIGIAQASGLATLVVDGDGAVLMNPVGLITAGAHDSLPLAHIVLDDGRYASTGGQAVPSRPDLGALARDCGYLEVHRVHTVGELSELLCGVLVRCSSPVFIHCVLLGAEPPVPPRVEVDLGDHAARFGAKIRELAKERR
ncbi:thiamine pyrophosphate-dependent enzyme [Amycolatopsis pittospori]|uniref:thiamine pyrophosphate-dependent enzyme n=1 Tax=Amycolatopsis pittospori TaxID=2749434 RepID=UPI0015F0C1D5|nr:thiamine pyrophosphate-dependent enzyme [Amycolatopsis pittospori]